MQPVGIAGPAGRLEGRLEEPDDGARRVSRFGVICHPHPLHGGTLDNKVVHTLARALHDLGVPTVRFNFRGVGASEGRYDSGIGETDDALAVVGWARRRWPDAAPWLLGFSFGGVIAIRAAARAGARLLVTVAPAVGRRIDPAVRDEKEIPIGEALPACPWLIIQGDADEVLDAGSVLEWASRQVPAPQVRVSRGAGHFFHGRLPELRAAVEAFAHESGAQPVG
ncbi:MAG: alpha/beta hydrolase [Steroidobacteraceae bacterium]